MTETITAPAEQVVDTAAPLVTVQDTKAEQTSPQADKPDGTEQSAAASDDPAKQEDPSQDEARKTWKEKRKERNRERWQEFKAAKDYTIKSLEQEVQRLRAKQAPDLSAITDPDDVIAEKTAWKLQQSSVAEKEQTLQQERDARASAQRQAVVEAWDDIREDMRERIPDFDQVVNESTPIHARAAPFIVESEKGGEIAYWLGKNPKEASALFQQFESEPARALIELGRLEARLSAPKAKTLSTAPKPAPVLTGGANPIAFDSQKASVEDWAQQLKKLGHIR